MSRQNTTLPITFHILKPIFFYFNSTAMILNSLFMETRRADSQRALLLANTFDILG